MSDNATIETITLPTDAVNRAFEGMPDIRVTGENPDLPGFNELETDGDLGSAKNGRYTALFIITRMSDGKKFAAAYTEAADDNFYAENPFRSPTNETEFREVEQRTETITRKFYAFK